MLAVVAMVHGGHGGCGNSANLSNTNKNDYNVNETAPIPKAGGNILSSVSILVSNSPQASGTGNDHGAGQNGN